MAFTALDPTTALIVIDLQRGIVDLPLAHTGGEVVDNSVRLVREFRSRNLPVVLVNVAGSPPGRTDENAGAAAGHVFPDDWTALIDELDVQPSDILVTKYARGAFSGTGLTETLRGAGVTQVVIAGIATGTGVESTARTAHEDGFHVSLPIDAMTDTVLEKHDHSIAKVFPRIAETGTTDELLRLLESGQR
jgi:nicotinamidase-related amidase